MPTVIRILPANNNPRPLTRSRPTPALSPTIEQPLPIVLIASRISQYYVVLRIGHDRLGGAFAPSLNHDVGPPRIILLPFPTELINVPGTMPLDLERSLFINRTNRRLSDRAVNAAPGAPVLPE